MFKQNLKNVILINILYPCIEIYEIISGMDKLIPIEIIENKIFIIRGQKVMLDRDLAQLYEVETKDLNRAVKRNIERFPEKFMFQLTNEEWKNLRCQIGTANKKISMIRSNPYVFTEHGTLMLSSVLNSKRAIKKGTGKRKERKEFKINFSPIHLFNPSTDNITKPAKIGFKS